MIPLAVLVCLIFASCTRSGPQAQDEVPAVFAKLEFAKALEQNKVGDKFLVVKATATWCAPCKQMDRTTWRDEKIVAWFGANGVAIHFDVDEEALLAKKLDIQAMPTMIVFKQGEEFDRVVGYKDPTEFLAWLEGVKNGKKSIEAVVDRAQRATKGTEAEIEARYDLARELLRKSEFEKATAEFVWLWENSANSSYSAVRVSFMASEIERLAEKWPAAKARFLTYRDEIAKRILGETVVREDFREWIVLNGILRETEQTLAWFDKTKSDPRWLPLLRSESYRIDKLLIAESRWADLAILHPDPAAEMQRTHEMDEMTAKIRAKRAAPEGATDFEELNRQHRREGMGQMYAAMLAAGHAELAQAVVKQAVEFDDSSAMRIALVQWALTAKQPRAEHAGLLDAAENQAGAAKAVADLRERLAKALAPLESR